MGQVDSPLGCTRPSSWGWVGSMMQGAEAGRSVPPRVSLASGEAFHVTSVTLKSDSFLFITVVPTPPTPSGLEPRLYSLVPSLSVLGHPSSGSETSQVQGRLQPGGAVLEAHPSILPCLLTLAADSLCILPQEALPPLAIPCLACGY